MSRKKKVQPIDQTEEVTAMETEENVEDDTEGNQAGFSRQAEVEEETPPVIEDLRYDTLKKAMLDWINTRPSLLQVQANAWLYEEWVQTLRRLIE